MIRILVLLLIVPFVELVLLLWLADHAGWLTTLGIIVGTAILGMFEIRRGGIRCWRRIEDSIDRGELPTEPLLDGLLILISGVLLMTPGLITDAIGFVLLFPPTRAWIRAGLRRRLARRLHVSIEGMSDSASSSTACDDWPGAAPEPRLGAQDDVIDVEFRDAE